MSTLDKKAIRRDKWMQVFMKIGIPAAIVSIICLWAGWLLKEPALGSVFIVTASVALIIGLMYNVRFVILSLRQLKDKKDPR